MQVTLQKLKESPLLRYNTVSLLRYWPVRWTKQRLGLPKGRASLNKNSPQGAPKARKCIKVEDNNFNKVF